jgi:hypothetical protein
MISRPSFPAAHLWEANMSARIITGIALFAGVVLSCAIIANAGPDPAFTDLKVIGPYTSGNLTVYLVRGSNLLGDKHYLTLREGLEKQTVIVREKQEVNQLTVENRSGEDLFVQAGEIVKGGKQDRTLGRDMILSAHGDETPIAANCVEHGRWTQRGSEDVQQFGASPNALASKALKQSNYAGNQQEVWSSVGAAQQKLAANTPGFGGGAPESPTSLELTEENGSVAKAAEAYEKDLVTAPKGASDVVGFIFAINGKLNSGDIYASGDLFIKMYPKLLHAAAVEALAEREPNSEKKTYEAPTPQSVEALITAVDAAKAGSQPLNASEMERDINAQANLPAPTVDARKGDRAVMLKKETDQIEMFETRDTQSTAPFVHRAYLTK